MIDFPHFPFMPPDLSTHGREIDSLMWWVHIVMALLFVGWGAFFVWTLIRFRQRRNARADHAGVQSHFPKYHEGAVVVVECLLLFVLSIPFWSQWVKAGQVRADQASAQGESPMVLRVIAQQFAWNVQYPGPDGKFGRLRVSEIDEQLNPLGLDPKDPAGKDDVQLQNQLIVPAHRPVVLQLASKDVIHSLSIPVMRVKQDAIPGMNIPIGFRAKMTSMEFKVQEFERNRDKYTDRETDRDETLDAMDVPDHELACAQLCGAQHFKMKGNFYVASPEDFAALKTRADFTNWARKFRDGPWSELKEGAAKR
jgi:cytochrome c oxidase subunit 2